jgi:hypothetical protein
VTVVKEGADLWRPKMTPWKRQILTQLDLMGDKPNLQVRMGPAGSTALGKCITDGLHSRPSCLLHTARVTLA